METTLPLTLTMEFAFDREKGLLIIRPPYSFKETETLEHARLNLEYGVALSGNQLRGILAFMPRHYVNAAATSYYRHHTPEVPVAMVANNFLEKMIGSFMLSLQRTKRPLALFYNEKEAHIWLEARMKETDQTADIASLQNPTPTDT